jgi:hypothetical protein
MLTKDLRMRKKVETGIRVGWALELGGISSDVSGSGLDERGKNLLIPPMRSAPPRQNVE